MTDLLSQLDPTALVALAGAASGAALWAVQRYWTDCPWLPLLGKTDSKRKKRLAAILLACLPGLLAGLQSGNWQQAGAVALTALLGSQATKLRVDTKAPEVVG